MPIYEYECGKCGRPFEMLRKMSDQDKEISCPHCNAKQAKRRMSSCAVSGGVKHAGGASSSCGHSSHKGFA